tara:strand:+ start:709 stop:1014 length:306 start_codon:yes stop_codon:yes gene_type:complete
MADILHGNDLDRKALQDKNGNWKKCLLCGGSAISGGSWLYAKHAVKKADRFWKTTEVWSTHGEYNKGTPRESGNVYTVKDREKEVHVLCALLELRHPTRRR